MIISYHVFIFNEDLFLFVCVAFLVCVFVCVHTCLDVQKELEKGIRSSEVRATGDGEPP